jgi:hypothetical protein
MISLFLCESSQIVSISADIRDFFLQLVICSSWPASELPSRSELIVVKERALSFLLRIATKQISSASASSFSIYIKINKELNKIKKYHK